MDSNLLKYMAFVKTAEYGSFSKAAQILNYSQSAVSRMISDLEKESGLSLLDRDRSGVRLTSDGMELLPAARSLCDGYRFLQTRVDELNGLKCGMIRIGTFSSAATHWLPKIIKEFQKSYPNIEYELLLGDYGEIEEWIAQGRVDCGFVRLPTRPEFETVFLQRDELLAILPQDHPLSRSDSVPLASLCGEPFLLLEKGASAEISDLFSSRGLSPRVRSTTWDDYAVMSMVESGLGVSILPQLILRRSPYRIAVKELDEPAYRDIGLALRDKKTASVAVKRFMEYLRYR